ncbi:preprotein translocase subunit YajC [Qipengyuania sp. S6317L1]|uniref:preprotein translocase subunit YajC n=1 Tax=Qipengyuania sp. S6317L1 TaxID=2926410 RepID=UPI001FF30B42|nr:preprotein translocase subunit YajC [Qipengyuania sp. S6317L1]MCK0099439.1 preprotein translocase subunit YajC [Qipengyuania sp. S6317L1]
MRYLKTSLLAGIASLAAASPAMAQEGPQSDQGRATTVQPYIEVSQILTAQLEPVSDQLTYTQVAVGVDTTVQGRRSGASVSVRYERNFGWGDDQVDTDTVSGIARGYLEVVPRAVTLQAGALASRSRVDGGGAVSVNPLASEDATNQIYSVYAGPDFQTRAGAVHISGNARVGYNRFEANNAVFDVNGDQVDVFDDSVTYSGQIAAGVRPGEALPVGLAVSAGGFQEDLSNLDQRVRDVYVRGDVTVPVTPALALVGGVGYEDVEVSGRDAVRDVNGDPVFDSNGRLVTDSASPRLVAFEVDGLLWDVGVLWRPSSRTNLEARVGRRYDSTTYYGTFSYQPNPGDSLAIAVYDGISGFGGVVNNSLSRLSTDFSVQRNPFSGDFGGLVSSDEGVGLVGALGSVRSSAFRGRGVNASYTTQLGRINAAIGAGYDRRTFIAAAGGALESADGIRDESYYLTGTLSTDVGRSGAIATTAYANWFTSNSGNGDLTAVGASAAYSRTLAGRLSARAAVALDYFDSEFSDEDFATASALLGLRYDF